MQSCCSKFQSLQLKLIQILLQKYEIIRKSKNGRQEGHTYLLNNILRWYLFTKNDLKIFHAQLFDDKSQVEELEEVQNMIVLKFV